MDKKQRSEELRRKIVEYFTEMYPARVEAFIEIESKINKYEEVVEEEPVHKVNRFGTRHLVPEKVKKELSVVKAKLPKNEVMEILRKDRKHPLWEKEVISWTAKDWESLFKLRDEK